MTKINDDINSLDTISDNQVKMLATYFYGYLKGKGYHADLYIKITTGVLENIEFYKSEDDKLDSNEKARYSFIVNQKWILFYFKKRSELTNLEIERLKEDFLDCFTQFPNKADESHVKIKTLDKAKLLTDKYI